MTTHGIIDVTLEEHMMYATTPSIVLGIKVSTIIAIVSVIRFWKQMLDMAFKLI